VADKGICPLILYPGDKESGKCVTLGYQYFANNFVAFSQERLAVGFDK